MDMSETTIEVELTLEEIGILALEAHKRDMKLNDFVVEVAINYANKVIENEGRRTIKSIEVEVDESNCENQGLGEGSGISKNKVIGKQRAF